jgi:wyosine [tRNA(Phe)-imidazoG37] synthetase (radical SAM superfamily)
MNGFRYIFGPVLSGRLGRSLGLDLLGRRVCSMNCVYCESGKLETLTVTRAPYVPAAELLAELEQWEQGRRERGEELPDAATMGGLGEPTLNTDMPAIIDGIRKILPGVPVAVLTNSSLITDAAVREELLRVDAVLPSMDSLVPEEFRAVNRGYPTLDPNAIAEGLIAFREGYEGKLYLEILLAQGINDSERNLELLADFCKRLQPDRVDVVTLSRPGTESFAKPVADDVLSRWRGVLCGLARSSNGLAGTREKGHKRAGAFRPDELETSVLASLTRRPQTTAQLAAALLAPEDQVRGAVERLLLRGGLVSDGGQPAWYRTSKA